MGLYNDHGAYYLPLTCAALQGKHLAWKANRSEIKRECQKPSETIRVNTLVQEEQMMTGFYTTPYVASPWPRFRDPNGPKKSMNSTLFWGSKQVLFMDFRPQSKYGLWTRL